MTAKSWLRLELLVTQCTEALRDPRRQSFPIWRGEMRAIVSAHHDLRKAREKAQKAAE